MVGFLHSCASSFGIRLLILVLALGVWMTADARPRKPCNASIAQTILKNLPAKQGEIRLSTEERCGSYISQLLSATNDALAKDPLQIAEGAPAWQKKAVDLLLWRAVMAHDLPAVQRYLDAGASVDLYVPVGRKGKIPLLVSGAFSDTPEPIVSLLIDRGAPVNAVDDEGRTPLYAIASTARFVKTGDTRPGKPRQKPPNPETVAKRQAVLERLLASGADVNLSDRDQRTPLHRAASATREAVRTLLNNGANVNAQFVSGETALMLATRGRIDIVETLLDAGAELEIAVRDGQTALHRAAA